MHALAIGLGQHFTQLDSYLASYLASSFPAYMQNVNPVVVTPLRILLYHMLS